MGEPEGAAFVLAAVATPAGISGAVLLLPFQVSVLGTPSPARLQEPAHQSWPIPVPVLVALAAAVGCVGAIYGIGGGSILAPVLTGSGRTPSEVAPAALASTFVTSVAGVITFTTLSLHAHAPVAPDWPTGLALGAGGLTGAYLGARRQSRLPEVAIPRIGGLLVVAIGTRYLGAGLG